MAGENDHEAKGRRKALCLTPRATLFTPRFAHRTCSAHRSMSEALIIKIIVVGIFTFLNGKKGFKDEDTELLNLPPPAASRSSNASLTICFLISAINCVMELEILKQLTREGERKGRRPKQIRNFGALVLLTEWLLVNRSCLFPTTPDSDSIPEETIQVGKKRQKVDSKMSLSIY